MENSNENYLSYKIFSKNNKEFGLPIETTLSFVKPKLSNQQYNFDTNFNIEPVSTPTNSSSTVNDITDIFGGSSIERWIPKLDISKEDLMFNESSNVVPSVKGTKAFNDAFDAVQSRIPGIRKYRDFLTKLAQRESSFNPKARAGNSNGTALGYFQFMPFNRKGLSDQAFMNNPELQIEMAYKLLNTFKNSFDYTDFSKAKAKGYTESAVLAGAWLGGPGGVKRFLNTGYNSQDNLGTSVKNYMDKFNKLV